MRYGTGINTKNILALSNSIPLVTTTSGANAFIPDTNAPTLFSYVRVADEAQDFADAVADLYMDGVVWDRQARNGRAYMVSNHGRAALLEDAKGVLDASRRRNKPLRSRHASQTNDLSIAQDANTPQADAIKALGYAYFTFLVCVFDYLISRPS